MGRRRKQKLKVAKSKPSLSASSFKQETVSLPLLNRDKHFGSYRTRAGYFNYSKSRKKLIAMYYSTLSFDKDAGSNWLAEILGVSFVLFYIYNISCGQPSFSFPWLFGWLDEPDNNDTQGNCCASVPEQSCFCLVSAFSLWQRSFLLYG